MALQPRDLKYKPLSPGDAFDKEGLKYDVETSRLIQGFDTSSKEGLEKYAELIVGDKNALDGASPESIDASRGYVLSEHARYEIANAGKMFGSLEDAVVTNAFVFSPEIGLHKKEEPNPDTEASPESISYNAVVAAIQEAHKRQEELKTPEKQRQILKQELDGLNDYVKGFWFNFAEDILRGYVGKAFDDSQQKLSQYGGAKKFAEERINVMNTLASEQAQKKKDLSDKVQKALKEKKNELGRELNAGESAEILDRFKQETSAMQQKYGKVGEDLSRAVSVLESAWYQTNYPQKPETNPAQNPEESNSRSDLPEGNPQAQGNPDNPDSSESPEGD